MRIGYIKINKGLETVASHKNNNNWYKQSGRLNLSIVVWVWCRHEHSDCDFYPWKPSSLNWPSTFLPIFSGLESPPLWSRVIYLVQKDNFYWGKIPG